MVELITIGFACLLLGVCAGLIIENLYMRRKIRELRAKYIEQSKYDKRDSWLSIGREEGFRDGWDAAIRAFKQKEEK